jgi:hypothetical protein
MPIALGHTAATAGQPPARPHWGSEAAPGDTSLGHWHLRAMGVKRRFNGLPAVLLVSRRIVLHCESSVSLLATRIRRVASGQRRNRRRSTASQQPTKTSNPT